MVNIAAASQATESIIDQEASEILSLDENAQSPDTIPGGPVAFVGYSAWRRDEDGDGNLSDQQVFVISDGRARLLPPCNDLRNHSPDGLSWGYLGSGPAQLALAMLMQVFQDWSRVQPIYQTFKEHFVARIPQYANWTADGADVHSLAVRIESNLK
jgi:hypothetical protein